MAKVFPQYLSVQTIGQASLHPKQIRRIHEAEAAQRGFEPRLTVPETVVLPLDDWAMNKQDTRLRFSPALPPSRQLLPNRRLNPFKQHNREPNRERNQYQTQQNILARNV